MKEWRHSFGVELDGNGAALRSVSPADVGGLVAAHGLVILRGFDVDADQLHHFSNELFDRPLVYGGLREKVSEDDTIQTVDLGREHLGLHTELAYVPVRPDLAVFHCQVPAVDGGETTFGDGAAVFAALQPSTQELLTSQRVRYHTVVRNVTWQRMFKTDSKEFILTVGESMPDVEGFFDEDDDLHIQFVTTPVFERRGQTVYAESVHRFGRELEPDWVQGLKKSSSNLEHGPLPDEVRDEISAVCLDLEQPADWRPGDVAVIDNWSVLHGRTAFSDPNRRILASFGYAAWARPSTAIQV